MEYWAVLWRMQLSSGDTWRCLDEIGAANDSSVAVTRFGARYDMEMLVSNRNTVANAYCETDHHILMDVDSRLYV